MNTTVCVRWFCASVCFCSGYCLILTSAPWDATDNCNCQCIKSQLCLILQFCGIEFVCSMDLWLYQILGCHLSYWAKGLAWVKWQWGWDLAIAREHLPLALGFIYGTYTIFQASWTLTYSEWILQAWGCCWMGTKTWVATNRRAISECFPVHGDWIKDHVEKEL